MDQSENIEKEACIDDTFVEADAVSPTIEETTDDAEPKAEDKSDGEESASQDSVPVFESEDWQDRIDEFERNYPLAKEFYTKIGDCILEDNNLWNDDSCLEKALLRVLCEQYTPMMNGDFSEDFLERNIYNNEVVKGRIISDYMDDLTSKKLPMAMNRGGRISLTDAARPKTIKEAGILAAKMMRR